MQDNVIKATNRQTFVKTEELSALLDFQKSLERYYEAVPSDHRLYYERRSQQFRSIPGLEKIRIVSISSQIRSFASMFLDRAHQASRYYGNLLASIESRIFIDGHEPAAYYASAYALFKLEYYFRRFQIDNQLRPFKYHMLGIFRVLSAGTDMPLMSSNKFKKYCDEICQVLWDEARCLSIILDTERAIKDVLGHDYDRDKAKESTILAQVIEKIPT